MKKSEVVIGSEYRVKIGQRLAAVKVIAQRERRPWGNMRRQTVFECRTQDTGRTIIASAARLRPMPPPAVLAMVDRMVAAAVDRDRLVLEADPAPLDIGGSLAAWAAVPVGAY